MVAPPSLKELQELRQSEQVIKKQQLALENKEAARRLLLSLSLSLSLGSSAEVSHKVKNG